MESSAGEEQPPINRPMGAYWANMRDVGSEDWLFVAGLQVVILLGEVSSKAPDGALSRE